MQQFVGRYLWKSRLEINIIIVAFIIVKIVIFLVFSGKKYNLFNFSFLKYIIMKNNYKWRLRIRIDGN